MDEQDRIGRSKNPGYLMLETMKTETNQTLIGINLPTNPDPSAIRKSLESFCEYG